MEYCWILFFIMSCASAILMCLVIILFLGYKSLKKKIAGEKDLLIKRLQEKEKLLS